MSETPKSDLESFMTEDKEELIIGLGEMTGLDDAHVHMLLEALPEMAYPVTVRAVSSSPKEQAKGNFRCLEITFNGATFRIANRIEKNRFFIADVSSSDGKNCAYIRFDQENIAGGDDRTNDIDGEWN